MKLLTNVASKIFEDRHLIENLFKIRCAKKLAYVPARFLVALRLKAFCLFPLWHNQRGNVR